MLVPSSDQGRGGVAGTVVARSQQRDPVSRSGLWPFPDLAFVQFGRDFEHGCALRRG